MENRAQLLSMIHRTMVRIKNTASREERFDLLDNVQLLSDILMRVAQYEQSLIMDLDVD